MWKGESRAIDTKGAEYNDQELYMTAHYDFRRRDVGLACAAHGRRAMPHPQPLGFPVSIHRATQISARETEKRVGTPIVPRIKHHIRRYPRANQRVHELVTQAAGRGGMVHVACDGGSTGTCFGLKIAYCNG